MIDSEPPEITGCPEDITTTTELGTSGTTVSWIAPTATDQVGVSQTTVSHGPFTMFDIGTTIVAYIFRDSNSNTAVCTFFVTVETVDTTPPEKIGCPDDIGTIVELGGISEESVNWTEPYATDLSGTPRRSQSHVPPSEFPLGVTVVEYTFVDTSNNTANCTFSVTVDTVDTTAPEPSRCPTDFDYLSGRHVTWTEPTSYDVSGNVTVLQSQWPGMFLTETTSVVYSFTDPSDNIAYCNFTINVVYDKIPPSITGCPDDIFVTTKTDQSETPVHWTEPYATDDYGRVMLIERSHRQRAYFPVGLTSVKYTFADDSYNKASCNFSVIVEHVDAIATNHSCPLDIIQDIDTGSLNTPVYWNTPRAVDHPGNASLAWHSHFSGDDFAVGKTTVKYVFVDESGNQENCTFVITVREVDTLAPTVSNCPPDITAPNGIERPVRSWLEPFATDSTGNATLLAKTHSPGDRFVAESTNIIYFFQDSSKNVAICSFYVILKSDQNTHFQVDTAAPNVFNCPYDIYESVELGLPHVAISWLTPSALDLHGGVTMVNASTKPGDIFFVGTTTNVSYIFADDADNLATCNFLVTVTQVDTRPPDILFCPDDISETIELGGVKKRVYWSEPQASDLSGNVTLVSQSHSSGHYFIEGKTEVNYTFVDFSGNVAVCMFEVSLNSVDTRAPDIINCPPDVNTVMEIGSMGSHVSWTEPTAIDASGNTTLLTQTHYPGGLFRVGDTNVIYLFADSSNNIAACNFIITTSFMDSTPPSIINCPTHINTSMEMGTRGITVSWNVPFAIDQSGKVTSNSSHEPGQSFPEGSTNVVYQFEDESRNRAECNFTVFVQLVDTIPPTIEFCPEAITDTIELGLMDKTVSWSEPIASDVLGTVSLVSQSYFSGDVFMVGKTEVKYVFIDGAGNEALCKFYVTLITVDSSSPIIVNCPHVHIHTTAEVGTFHVPIFWNEPSASDASGVTHLQSTHKPGQTFSVGVTNVSYKFTDSSYNSEFCNFTVIVDQVDTIPPDINACPSDIHETVEMGTSEISVVWNDISAYDRSGNVTLVHYTHRSGDLFTVGSTKVSHTFTDGSNNSVICEFIVTVSQIDTIAPTIIYCPDDIDTDVDLGSLGAVVTWDEPKAEDASKVATLFMQTHISGTFFTAGTTFVTYIFRDNANNMETCSFTITVMAVDTATPRLFNCPSTIQATTESGKHEASVSWIEPFAVNLSPATKISSTRRPNDSFEIGSTPVVYVFEDDVGSRLFCNFTVVVTDTVEILGEPDVKRYTGNVRPNSGYSGLSVGGLVLSLMVVLVLLICGSIALLIYIRKRRSSSAIELESLSMSTTCSHKTASKL